MHHYCHNITVNDLVEAFGDLYSRSNVHFTTPYDASTALYSMQGLSSNVASSRKLMALIATSMESVKVGYVVCCTLYTVYLCHITSHYVTIDTKHDSVYCTSHLIILSHPSLLLSPFLQHQLLSLKTIIVINNNHCQSTIRANMIPVISA